MNMIGQAWLDLAKELERKLQGDDPAARVYPWIDFTGLLRLKVSTRADRSTAARAEARCFEGMAAGVCEQCGSAIDRVRSGPMMAIFLCPDCAPD